MKGKLTINLAWLYGGEACAKVLGLLVFAYLGRTFGPAVFGDLEFAITVLFILNLAQEAGLAPYGAREAARQPERTRTLVGQVILVRALVAVGTLGLLSVLVLVLAKPASAETLVLLYGLVLLPAPLMLNWVFQARDEMSVVAAGSVLRQGVLAAGVFLSVRTVDDAWRVPVWDACGLLALVALHQVLFRRRVGRLDLRGATEGARVVLREALPLAASSLAWALRINAPLLALWLFRDSHSAGLYGSGTRLVISAHTFVWLYFFNLLPSLSRAWVAPGRAGWDRLLDTSLRLVSWTVPTGCLFLTALAPVLIPAVYASEFSDAAGIFQVQVWMLCAAFLSGHQRYALIAAGHQRAELVASLAGAAISVGTSLLLLGSLTPAVAAVVFVAAEVGTLAVADRLLARVAPFRFWPALLRPGIATGVALSVVLLAGPERPFLGALAAGGVAVAGLLLEPGLLEALRRDRPVRAPDPTPGAGNAPPDS